jgi:hypothetical protein
MSSEFLRVDVTGDLVFAGREHAEILRDTVAPHANSGGDVENIRYKTAF